MRSGASYDRAGSPWMATNKRSTNGASATAPAARASFVTWLPAHVSAAASATFRTAPAGPKPAQAPQACALRGGTPARRVIRRHSIDDNSTRSVKGANE